MATRRSTFSSFAPTGGFAFVVLAGAPVSPSPAGDGHRGAASADAAVSDITAPCASDRPPAN